VQAARAAAPDRRLVVAFQPHLYSRTRDFAAEFGEALVAADVVFLVDVYGAREGPIDGVSSALIAAQMAAHGRAPVWQGPRSAVCAALVDAIRDNDLVVTMGAGDVTRVGPELLAARQQAAR
jgi:UDP-N-acetylmuramate--alanine ligase